MPVDIVVTPQKPDIFIVTNTNLSKLDAINDKYIKKWLSMPQSATMAVVHAREGLNIKSVSHATSHVTSRLKADKMVNSALDSRVSQEEQWTRKGSITTYSESHFNMIQPDVPPQITKNHVETIKNKVKSNHLNVAQEFYTMWHHHIKELVVHAGPFPGDSSHGRITNPMEKCYL